MGVLIESRFFLSFAYHVRESCVRNMVDGKRTARTLVGLLFCFRYWNIHTYVHKHEYYLFHA